jgi:hypothetical protein
MRDKLQFTVPVLLIGLIAGLMLMPRPVESPAGIESDDRADGLEDSSNAISRFTRQTRQRHGDP